MKKLSLCFLLALFAPIRAGAVAVVDSPLLAATQAAATANATGHTATAAATAALPAALIAGVTPRSKPDISLGMVIQSGFNDLILQLTQSYGATAQMTAEVAVKEAKATNQRDINKLNTITIQNQTPAANTCITRTMAAAAEAVGAANKVAQADMLKKFERKMHGGARASGGSASAAAKVEDHTPYCNKETDNACESNASDPDMLDADKKVESILYGAGNAEKASGVLTYTEKQKKAAESAKDNIMSGAETPRMLSKAEANTPAGVLYRAKSIEYETLLSAAHEPILAVLASRSSTPESSQITAVMRKNVDGDSGKWVIAELDKIRSKTGKNEISSADLLRIEIGRRVDNPGWMKDIQAANNSTTLMRELVFMQALSLKMQYAAYLSGESKAILDGSQAANNVRQRLLPELKALERSTMTNAAN